uniref:Uncharacterized protein n=1 Tax=Zea mays TaxID=4577 RepID=C0P9X4_MAIZE|nr:unknown [Zea mays]
MDLLFYELKWLRAEPRLPWRLYLFCSKDTAALSVNQVNSPSCSTAISTGSRSDEVCLSESAFCTAAAFPAPVTTIATYADELITGNVNVILSGGGFGESLMYVTHLSFSLTRGWPGKRDAMWPSGPIPRSWRSNLGNPVAADIEITPFLTSCFRHAS